MIRLNTFLPLAFLAMVSACAMPPPSGDEQNMQAFYANAKASLRAQGKMRTDFAPADAPFTYADLVTDFTRIALYDEYNVANGRFVARQSPAFLRRWNSPVRVAVVSGASVPAQQRRRDVASVTKFTARLARLSGLDMKMASQAQANMLVLYLDTPEQRAFAAGLKSRFPRVGKAVIDAFAHSPRNTFCAAYAFPSTAQPAVYDFALVLIKSEHSDAMRTSCIHEEMTQALGLTNDSPSARPSIFNDDEEFAYLTLHDEILLKMLYDPRLHAGMKAREVVPLLPAIARSAMQPAEQ